MIFARWVARACEDSNLLVAQFVDLPQHGTVCIEALDGCRVALNPESKSPRPNERSPIAALKRIVIIRRAASQELHDRYHSLTPREREVMAYVVAGLLNKQIAAELGMSETTVKIHRHRVMEKMGADSLA